MIENIIVLPVILLIFGTAILPFFKSKSWAAIFTLLYFTAFTCVIVFSLIISKNNISYYFGGFLPPQGIEYNIDRLNILFLMMNSIVMIPIILYSYFIVQKEINREKIPLLYCLSLSYLAGIFGIYISNDLFNIFVLIEISSLSSYGLITFSKNKKASIAAFDYLIIGTVGASLYLLGVGILYSLSGTLNINDMRSILKNFDNNDLLTLSYVLIITSLFVKTGIFPMQNWLPGIYAYSPSFVSSMFSASSASAMIYLLIKFNYTIFNSYIIEIDVISGIIKILAVLSIIYGSVSAIFQKNINKLLAYSSVSTYGFILLGISLGTVNGLISAIILLISHSTAKSTLYMSTGAIHYRLGTYKLNKLQAVFQKLPWTSSALIINLLTVIGLPPFISFYGKWILLEELFKNNIPIAGIVLIGSLLSVLYGLKIIEKIMFRGNNENEYVDIKLPPYMILSAIFANSFIIILMTIYSGEVFNYLNNIANMVVR